MGMLFFAFCVLLFICACSTTKNINSSGVVFTNGFYTTRTSQGIPIIVKQSVHDVANATIAIVFFHNVQDMSKKDVMLERECFRSIEKSLRTKLQPTRLYCKFNYDYYVCLLTAPVENTYDTLFDTASCFLQPDFSVRDERPEKMNDSSLPHLPPPELAALNVVLQEVYQSHPYSVLQNEEGKELVPDFVGDELYAYYTQSLLHAQNMAFVLCGDFTGVQAARLVMEIERMCKTVLLEHDSMQSWQDKPTITPPAIIPGDTIIVPDDTKPRYVYATFTVPQYDDEDYIPFAFATMYLNDMLQVTLVERNMTAQSAGIGLIGGTGVTGILSVNNCTEKRLDDCKEQIEACLRDFPSESEIDALLVEYKRDYIRKLVRSTEKTDSECLKIIESACYLKSEQAYTARIEKVSQITAAQIKKAAITYLTSEKMHWYMVE